MKWNTHIDKICAEASSRLYFLKQLKQTGLAADQLRHFCLLAIRPYCSVVWHHGLNQNTGRTAWGCKRCTIRIIFQFTSNMPYQSAMACAHFWSLHACQEDLSKFLLRKILNNPDNTLFNSLPPTSDTALIGWLCIAHLLPIPSTRTPSTDHLYIMV